MVDMKKFVGGTAIILVAVFLIATEFGGLDAQRYEVTDWEEQGYLDGEMLTDGEILYIDEDTNEDGTWASDIINQPNSTPEVAEILADTRGGTVEFTINMWETSDVNAEPDEEIVREVGTGENEFNYNLSDQYNYFEYEIYIDKDQNDGQLRPNVEELSVITDAENVDFTSPRNFYLLFTLLLLLWGIYAIFK